METQYAKNRAAGDTSKIGEQIRRLRRELAALKREIYSQLDPWQTVQVSRHQQRPQTRDYLDLVFEQFLELHGDRAIGDDKAIVTGLAHLDDMKVMFIGHQKGKNLAERTACHFGCAHPEGYRKALLKMRFAAKFGLPIISFIDTPVRLSGNLGRGAGPGGNHRREPDGDEPDPHPDRLRRDRRGRLWRCPGHWHRRPPGNARAHLLLGDQPRRLRLDSLERQRTRPQSGRRSQVHQPRSAALRHHRRDHPRAIRSAHRDHREAASNLKSFLLRNLRELKSVPLDDLVDRRYQKYRKIGVFVESIAAPELLDEPQLNGKAETMV